MSKMAWHWSCVGFVALTSGCSEDAIPTADVVTIEPCATAPCTSVADGSTRTTVKTCIAEGVENRKSDLKARLTTTLGSWVGAEASSPASIEASFGNERCVSRELLAPRDPGTGRVTSEVAGFRAEATVEFSAVPLGALELVPAPASLDPTKATTVILNVAARAETGKPTAGTGVDVSLASRDPAGAAVVVYPTSTVLDDKQRATVSVFVPAGTKSVSVRVDATLPGGADTISETIVLSAPVDGKDGG